MYKFKPLNLITVYVKVMREYYEITVMNIASIFIQSKVFHGAKGKNVFLPFMGKK